MSSLDVVNNVDIEVDEEPKPKGAEAPPGAEPAPIPTESSADGFGLVSRESLKRRLQIPVVNIKHFADYVKAKKQNAELVQEWEVSTTLVTFCC